MTQIEPRDVLDFWISAGPEKWFTKDDDFDAEIERRFGDALRAAKTGIYDEWTETIEGTLALIILLDQFSRNVHRTSAEAFAADGKALKIAKDAVARGRDMELPQDLRIWVYMPYEHSENLDDQETCIELFARTGSDDLMKWAKLHADIIRQFGRFPHRNEALGRVSTAEEIAFLENGGFSG